MILRDDGCQKQQFKLIQVMEIYIMFVDVMRVLMHSVQKFCFAHNPRPNHHFQNIKDCWVLDMLMKKKEKTGGKSTQILLLSTCNRIRTLSGNVKQMPNQEVATQPLRASSEYYTGI